MNKTLRFAFSAAILCSMFTAGCTSTKPEAINEIIQSSDPMSLIVYDDGIRGTQFAAAINVKNSVSTALESAGADETFTAMMEKAGTQYETIWNTFGDSLVQYLKDSDFKETDQEPSRDDLSFQIETPKSEMVYFYRSNMVKIAGDERKFYTASSMDNLLNDLNTAVSAYSDLISSLTNTSTVDGTVETRTNSFDAIVSIDGEDVEVTVPAGWAVKAFPSTEDGILELTKGTSERHLILTTGQPLPETKNKESLVCGTNAFEIYYDDDRNDFALIQMTSPYSNIQFQSTKPWLDGDWTNIESVLASVRKPDETNNG